MPFNLTMPKLSPTMENGTIAAWHKKVGDKVEPGDLLIEVSTDKATVEHSALDGGYLRKILVEAGGDAAVNQPIAIFTETAEEPFDAPLETSKIEPKKVEVPKAAVPQPAVKKDEARVIASPLAKKLASDKGIDLSKLQGTGPGGRIVSRDLPQAKSAVPAGTFEEEALTPIRKVIAERLQQAKMTIPHFYVTLEVDVEPLIHLREQLSQLEKKVSLNDLVVKACSLALQDHPGVNSGFNAKNNTIIRFKSIDISIAVSVESGLITPIVPQADLKSVTEISSTIRALAKKAREGKLKPEEFQGGSFTVSNLGMYGITEFQAIINPPQAAILAVSSVVDKPVIKNGEIVKGKTMNLTVSVDHRVIDGVLAAQFLKSVQKYIENPISLIIQ
jgi:pyruvate dehydrogenase E2 component (dihydrolipoamide acetyltransferase)